MFTNSKNKGAHVLSDPHWMFPIVRFLMEVLYYALESLFDDISSVPTVVNNFFRAKLNQFI
jgi:hypothetical protein